MEKRASDFLPSERLELSSGIYTLRLSKYWQEKLLKDENIDSLSFYRMIMLGEEIEGRVFKNTIGSIFYGMINNGQKQYSIKEAEDIVELAINEIGIETLQTKIVCALNSAFMTQEQYEKFKELVEILKENDDAEAIKKLTSSNKIMH
ncbi:hypothetical protein [Listeria monocytogenes]|uniref:hypothetical protein n=1 Tax=Listeria monocytogenes TaxID=1639 RepID=UPI00138822FE|nr:hypothetical protein [Listeria monocytogenes]EAG4620059.1 hypothetical protein [Listeria monocytogenes]EDN9533436.1 hypothetical protein [Listeria monocytogenes]EDN9536243.1 hypothetical protein [Listeria monocytogenes]EHL5769517.1 hypothetical protein [Listeria monocytogenes]